MKAVSDRNPQLAMIVLVVARLHLEVSTNGGTPKYMVYSGKSQSKMDDDLGVPPFMETSTS